MLRRPGRFGAVLMCFTLVFLSACSTSPTGNIDNIYRATLDEDDLYLRGTFNWWGNQDAFKFKASSANTWQVDVALIADGTVHDFKVANSTWSQQQNCGAYAVRVRLDKNSAMKIFCGPSSENYQFMPDADGNYRFSLARKGDIYWLRVDRLSK